MSYNINYKLCFAVMALILGLSPNQVAWAVLPLDAEQTAPTVVPLIPDEISLKETSNADALLTPPSLNGNSGNIENNVPDIIPLDNTESNVPGVIPLDNTESNVPGVIPLDNTENNVPSVQDLKLPQTNPEKDDASKPVLKPLGAKSAPSAPKTLANDKLLPAKNSGDKAENKQLNDNASKFQQLQLLKQQATTPESNNFGEAILSQIDNDLFNQMSDLEKQTSLLSLELRREKVKNEIEALKAARQKSIDDAKAQKEEKERKKAEWEQEQQIKLLIEEQKLRELNLIYEKLRQENIIKAYKEEMLATNQKWIDNNMNLYDEMAKIEEDHSKLVNNLKLKLNYLLQLAVKASEAAETAKKNYSRELTNMQTQISILKSRLEAEKQARVDVNVAGKDKTNPFASLSENNEKNENKSQKISDEYAIMEIRGKGGELSAKLINKSGSSFLVQKGTVLQTGHTVDEISQTYLTASKDGKKEYLYFAAGGILDREPKSVNPNFKSGVTPLPKKSGKTEALPALSANQGLPSLRSGMFVR